MREKRQRSKSAPELLRDWRGRRTLEDAAGELHISFQHLHGLENGNRSLSLDLAFRIERIVGIPAELWTDVRAVAAAAK